MKHNSEIKCCKCGKKSASIVNGEVQFRGVDVDWVKLTEISKTGQKTKYKCRSCYTINTVNENHETSIDEKEVARDLLNNFKSK